jgi:hypothetical protein
MQARYGRYVASHIVRMAWVFGPMLLFMLVFSLTQAIREAFYPSTALGIGGFAINNAACYACAGASVGLLVYRRPILIPVGVTGGYVLVALLFLLGVHFPPPVPWYWFFKIPGVGLGAAVSLPAAVVVWWVCRALRRLVERRRLKG